MDQMYVVSRGAKKVQTGYFEKLLCSECEALLSRYEAKFKNDWMDTIPQDLNQLGPRLPDDPITVSNPRLFGVQAFSSIRLVASGGVDGIQGQR